MSDCIFCKIVAGSIPSARVYEDAEFICIRDIQPHAKTHLLVIPKVHVASLAEVFPETGFSNSQMVGRMFEVGTKIARAQGLVERGFRAVINTGKDGGQTVFHLHLHLLGGQSLSAAMA
jgi:histidine triad (HIT) family protein